MPERKVPSAGRPARFRSGLGLRPCPFFCLCCCSALLCSRLPPLTYFLPFDRMAVLHPGALSTRLCFRPSFLVIANAGNTGHSDLDSRKAAVHAGCLGHTGFSFPAPKGHLHCASWEKEEFYLCFSHFGHSEVLVRAARSSPTPCWEGPFDVARCLFFGTATPRL